MTVESLEKKLENLHLLLMRSLNCGSFYACFGNGFVAWNLFLRLSIKTTFTSLKHLNVSVNLLSG
jgi:hypothetical protein